MAGTEAGGKSHAWSREKLASTVGNRQKRRDWISRENNRNGFYSIGRRSDLRPDQQTTT